MLNQFHPEKQFKKLSPIQNNSNLSPLPISFLVPICSTQTLAYTTFNLNCCVRNLQDHSMIHQENFQNLSHGHTYGCDLLQCKDTEQNQQRENVHGAHPGESKYQIPNFFSPDRVKKSTIILANICGKVLKVTYQSALSGSLYPVFEQWLSTSFKLPFQKKGRCQTCHVNYVTILDLLILSYQSKE